MAGLEPQKEKPHLVVSKQRPADILIPNASFGFHFWIDVAVMSPANLPC